MNTKTRSKLSEDLLAIGQQAKAAAHVLALASAEQKDRGLRAAAAALRASVGHILETNASDRKAAEAAWRPARSSTGSRSPKPVWRPWRAGSKR